VTDQELAATVAEGGRLRALLLELWQRTRMDWGFVTDRLAVTFRKEKWLGASERRFVGETLYALVRHLRRVDLALERARATKQAPRDLERLIALLVLEQLIDPARAARVVPELDWRAAAGVDEAIAGERDPAARIALACSLPDWLAARLVADWRDDAEPLARALNQRAPMTVRANLLVVADRGELARELGELATHPGAHCDTALIVDTRTNLFGLDAFRRGAFEAQDEGSQLLADLVVAAAPANKPLVIDYCAGAGGKTLAIAARLGNRGRIIATDVDSGKLEELRRRARRARVSNAQAMLVDQTAPPFGGAARRARGPAREDRALDAYLGKADVVFVDAPCTGIGALRRNPEARWRLREADIAGFAQRQREILAAATALCAPTGRVVYATCSLLSAENEQVVAGTPTIPLAEIIGEARASHLDRGGAFTVTPHQHGTDGFFARVLRRND
jgi:16S rRNA (cytosine967-C5)-methyltransferase